MLSRLWTNIIDRRLNLSLGRTRATRESYGAAGLLELRIPLGLIGGLVRETVWCNVSLLLLVQCEFADRHIVGADQQGYRSTRMPIAEDGMSSVNASTADLVERYLDFAFVGLDISSGAEQDGTVAVMEQLYQIKEMMGPADESNYKFIMDVDVRFLCHRYPSADSTNRATLGLADSIESACFPSRIKPQTDLV